MTSLYAITHNKSLRKVKGEDFVAHASLVPLHMGAQPYSASVFLIADGLGPMGQGQACAKFISSRFPELLSSRLPPVHDPSGIQEALCEAFLAVDEAWSSLGDACDASGSTLTAVLVTESDAGQSLVTCASVGDSFAYMDTGRSIYELSANHRIDENPGEAARLLASSCVVAKCGVNTPIAEAGAAGIGPRRVWPGGLVCSRSIGDIEAAAEVIPVPHCRQVSVPDKGCRVIIASDGLWDAMPVNEVITFSRSRNVSDAATGLMRKSAMNFEVDDDCSVLVIDVLPSPSALYSQPSRDFNNIQTTRSESTMGKSESNTSLVNLPSSPTTRRLGSMRKNASFANLAQEVALPRKSSSGFLGIFACGVPIEGLTLPDAREEPIGSLGHVATLSDADAAVTQPLLMERYQELSSRPGGRRSHGSSLAPSADSTQHSGISALTALQQLSASSAARIISSPATKTSQSGGGWNRVTPVEEDDEEEEE